MQLWWIVPGAVVFGAVLGVLGILFSRPKTMVAAMLGGLVGLVTGVAVVASTLLLQVALSDRLADPWLAAIATAIGAVTARTAKVTIDRRLPVGG